MLTPSISATEQSSRFFEEAALCTTQGLRLSEKERIALNKSLASRLILRMTETSGCTEPLRVAATNLTTLAMAKRNPAFYRHQPGESLLRRLQPLNRFPGGDPAVIRAGMLLLEHLSLNDHKADLAEDIIRGKQNPLIVDLDYQEEVRRINTLYKRIPFRVRELFTDIYQAVQDTSFWL